MLYINEIQHLCHDENIVVTKHAKNRFIERNISVNTIKEAIQCGEIIKQYEDDKPFPSCLILGVTSDHKPLHLVVSLNGPYLYIITAYYPDEAEWDTDYKERRR